MAATLASLFLFSLAPSSHHHHHHKHAHAQQRLGHAFRGVDVAAAGVIPYTQQKGKPTLFFLQELKNGTRKNLLSDFGGRREDHDQDFYDTAAREFAEETNFVFGHPAAVAIRLRRDATVRILNRNSRYLTFFLKVSPPETEISSVDNTAADGPTARQGRWLRADELMCEVECGSVLARLINGRYGESFVDRRHSGVTSLHRALIKTMSLENAHPDAHERWAATVLPSLVRAGEAENLDGHRDISTLGASKVARGRRKKSRRHERGGHHSELQHRHRDSNGRRAKSRVDAVFAP